MIKKYTIVLYVNVASLLMTHRVQETHFSSATVLPLKCGLKQGVAHRFAQDRFWPFRRKHPTVKGQRY